MPDPSGPQPKASTAAIPSASVIPAEIARFEKLGDQWWDLNGPQKALHRLNLVRVDYLRKLLCGHFADGAAPRDRNGVSPLRGLSIVDIGCGGGLLSESLARLGAQMTGVDPAAGNTDVATRHAQAQGLEIDYRTGTVEALSSEARQFDVVLAMEVIEHVADWRAFLQACAKLVRPGGLFVGATLNRTVKSYALAIVGAEYILRWVEAGTHDWSKFLKPDELAGPLLKAGLTELDRAGITFHALRDEWRLSGDFDVNYMIAMERPEHSDR